MEGKDLRNDVPGVHVDLPRLRKGRVGLQVFAAYVPADTEAAKAFAYATERLDAIAAFAASSDLLTPVETAAELMASMAQGKTGVMAAVENGLAIEGSLEKLKELRRLKVRIMTLVHSQNLDWVGSCTGTARSEGLSGFGGEVIDAMNDLGIIPDLSHSSEASFWDVIKRTKKPVIASHSCAWALCGAARNLKDDQLKALGDSGGVVGVNFFSAFLSEPFRKVYDKEKASDPAIGSEHVSRSIIADHIDHIIKMAGEDCVALGSDFDGISATPEGVSGCDFFPVLEEDLRAMGYTEKRIEKIFNKNFLRVLEAWD